MPEQIYIGNFPHGQVTSRLPFVIDNDAFPNMFNFYTWRGRAKRKRGTIFLGQLQLQEQIAAVPLSWQLASFNAVAGAGNLISQYTLGTSASITPGSISLAIAGDQIYTDVLMNGTLQGSLGGTGTINYATGAFTTSGSANTAVTGTFSWFPGLPVMGLRDYGYSNAPGSIPVPTIYPQHVAFDTKYAYQFRQTSSLANYYDVSYYKITNNPVTWSGQDYQQFWTTSYQGAMWTTNNKPGFNFKVLSNVLGVSVTRVTATQVTITIIAHGLLVNDIIWINEVTGTIATGTGNANINGQTGMVTAIVDANTITVDFTGVTNQTSLSNFGAGTTGVGGIAQYLTSAASAANQDGIRWYDGDMTNQTGLPTTAAVGWVNFTPPLTATAVSIGNLPADLYYLVGALMIVPFKDRLLFFAPWVQTSTGNAIQLTNTVLWCWNGTPYYSVLTPAGQTFDMRAYYQDQTGLGGNANAGIDQPITTVAPNEDVLIVGFAGNGRKTRFVYSGNDLNPFLFFSINSELPSDCTFSSVTLDRGVIDIGVYGIAMTDQQSSERIDLSIPDSVFQIAALNNGIPRVNAARDFYREWVYFSYPVYGSRWIFPTQTFLFNYRDNTWGIFYENFTAHGLYRPQVKKSWSTTGFKSWITWREPWNSGANSPQFPNVVAGNPEGYVLIKGQGTGEAISGTIKAIANDGNGNAEITAINHCVNIGDFLYITGCLGTTAINGLIGKVLSAFDANTFVLDLPVPSGTYLGRGKFTRLSQPLLQTKQFNPYWDKGRQARLSCQKYLMDFTSASQVTVNIYLSQDPDEAWNSSVTNPPPNSLIYSQIMYTCPESTNIGLTPANTNLQMPTAADQFQIWHRFNTSLIGDSFQVGITLSEVQMKNLTYATSEITLQGMHLTVDLGPHLA